MKFGDSLIYQRFKPGHYTGHGYAITRNQPQPDDWCFEIDNEVGSTPEECRYEWEAYRQHIPGH